MTTAALAIGWATVAVLVLIARTDYTPNRPYW